MTTIACLGWGSLVWDQQDLPIQGGWLDDGPFIHVEFARQSMDGRITLVLTQTEKLVRSYWATMATTDVAIAKTALRKRENIPHKNEDMHIGVWSSGQPSPSLIPTLSDWATAQNVQHVIWTNLPPKFNGMETTPTSEQVINYLSKLSGSERDRAERYIRCAPLQIDTLYRRNIAAQLQWSVLNDPL